MTLIEDIIAPAVDTAIAPYTSTQAELATLSHALSHPARIAILEMLARAGCSCGCGAIVDKLPLAQATVSGHLRVLREAGLIEGEVSGRQVCYCLSSTGVAKAQELLGSLLVHLSQAQECPCEDCNESCSDGCSCAS